MLKAEEQVETFSTWANRGAVRSALFTPVPLALWPLGLACRWRAFASGPKTYKYFRIMRH